MRQVTCSGQQQLMSLTHTSTHPSDSSRTPATKSFQMLFTNLCDLCHSPQVQWQMSCSFEQQHTGTPHDQSPLEADRPAHLMRSTPVRLFDLPACCCALAMHVGALVNNKIRNGRTATNAANQQVRSDFRFIDLLSAYQKQSAHLTRQVCCCLNSPTAGAATHAAVPRGPSPPAALLAARC